MHKFCVAIMMLFALTVSFRCSVEAVSTDGIDYSGSDSADKDLCVQTIVLDRSLYPESTHNYAHYLDETKSISYSGAKSITLIFDGQSFTEAKRDLLYIMDGSGNSVAVLSGDLRNKEFTVYDDTVQIRFVTDSTVSRYGYRFSEIKADVYVHSPIEVPGYLPSCTKDGNTASVSCGICGTVISESIILPATGHVYCEGRCIECGQQKLFDIPVSRMILGNALEFQFGVEQSAQLDWTGAYAVIEKNWADGTVTTKIIPYEQWGVVPPYFSIVYDCLAAKEMADSFKIVIYNNDHHAISNPKNDSVRDYVHRAFDSQSETGQTMLVDMLNYGAAAQEKFKYNILDLANNRLTDAQLLLGTKDVAEFHNNQVKGKNYLATRFVLQSRIQVQVAFGGLTSDMYAIYSYTNQKGNHCEVHVKGTDFISAGTKKGIELSDLVYADARTLVTVIVYNSDGTVYGYAEESIESCAYRSRSGNDVFVALMKFADSARRYLY